MGLKKYSEEEAKKVEEAEIEAQKQEAKEAPIASDEDVLSVIEENQKEEDALNAQPLEASEEEVCKVIEKGRQAYYSEQKKVRRINTISSVGLLAVLIAAFVLMIVFNGKEEYAYITYIGLGVMIVCLIGAFVFSKITKKRLTVAADAYLDLLCKTINGYLFSGENFSDLTAEATRQLDKELFLDARIYKDLKGTKSRNTVSVKYKGKLLQSAELAASIQIKNRLSPMFLGRFYDYENTYDKNGCRILMQIKGGNLSRPVDDLDGIELVENNKNYIVYTNDKEWKKVLSAKTISKITALKIDKTLIDVIVSIRPGKTCIGIDYSDEFMSIFIDKEFDFNTVKRCQRDLAKVLTILDEIQ